MERHKLIRQFVDFIFALLIFIVAFLIGQTVGKAKTKSEYKIALKKISLEQDTIRILQDSLDKRQKEILASPCFKK